MHKFEVELETLDIVEKTFQNLKEIVEYEDPEKLFDICEIAADQARKKNPNLDINAYDVKIVK